MPQHVCVYLNASAVVFYSIDILINGNGEITVVGYSDIDAVEIRVQPFRRQVISVYYDFSAHQRPVCN